MATTEKDSKQSIGYTHSGSTEMQAFLAKLKAVAHADGADTLKVYKHARDKSVPHGLSSAAYTAANMRLYMVITRNLNNNVLSVTLENSYDDDGVEALRYIRDCFATAGNENKEEAAKDRYLEILSGVKSGVNAFELSKTFNELAAIKTDLKESKGFAVSEEAYCKDIIRMVRKLSTDHKREVKDGVRDMDEDDLDKPAKVQAMLEGVVTSVNKDRENERKEAARNALAVTNDVPAGQTQTAAAGTNPLAPLQAAMQLQLALAAMQGGNGNTGNANFNANIERCGECGLNHFIAPGETCHTKLLAEGKEVPGWSTMDASKQARMIQRAEEYKNKGPFKDRSAADKAAVINPNGGGGGRGRANGGRAGGFGRGRGGRAAAALIATLLSGMPMPTNQISLPIEQSRKPSLPSISMMRANAVTAKYGAAAMHRLIVDTGNLTGKHLISNKDLFSHLDETAAGMPVKSASNDISKCAGEGTCTFVALDHTSPSFASSITLDECSYVPGFGVNLLSVQKLHEQGARVDLDAYTITFANGTTIPFDADFTMHIMPTPKEAYPVVVSRGKHGPTRIANPTRNLTATQQASMDLWCDKLNGAPAAKLKELYKYVDGAPLILRLANDHNALSVPRLMASGKQMNAPARNDGPIATKPGQITSIDWWDAPCTGILGGTGFFALIDNYSSRLMVYPADSKGRAASVTDLYHRDAAHDGVIIELGSVAFSDNELIFTSRKFEDKLSELGLVHEHSAEYEPWGNGGVESVNRTILILVRTAHIRSGAPDVFWEFTVVDAAGLCNKIQCRDGKSLYERWCGKRPSISGRKVLFCKAIARKPVPWRDGKIDAQQIEGVYCGKARRKQGYYVWTPEYGLVTSTNVIWFENDFPFKDGTMEFTPHPSMGHSSGLRILTGLDPATAQRTLAEGDPNGANLPGDYVPPAATANDDPPPADPPSRNTRSAQDLSNVPMSDLANGCTARRVAFVNRALDDTRIGLQECILRSPGTISGDDAGLLGRVAASASNPEVRSAIVKALTTASTPKAIHEALFQALVAHSAASAAPGGASSNDTYIYAASAAPGGASSNDTYIPQPKERLADLDEPTKAMWEAPDKKEIDGILEWAEVIKLSDLPAHVKIIGLTMQRSIKRDGTLKTRCCVQGFSQIWGLHYDRSHSPCVMHSSLRCIDAVGACLNASMHFIDFTQAYCQSELKPSEYIYVRPPPGYEKDEDGNEVVWLLKRSLYGMVQSGRNWYFRLREWLVSYGFNPSFADPCVYTKKTANGIIIIGVYVDDVVILSTDTAAKDTFVKDLAKDFEFTDQGRLTEMLGIQFGETDDYRTISLGKYIDKLAERYLNGSMANRKEHKTPASQDLPKLVLAATDSDAPVDPEVHKQYRSLVGALLFAALTVRPDIAYAVGMLSRALNKPDARLLDEARRVLYYLVLTRDIGPRYKRGAPVELTGMTDSDWAVTRSTSGFAFFMAGAVIAYMSKKQATIAMSSTEAEIMAASQAGLEAVFLRSLLSDMGYKQSKPTDLYVDNKGAIDMSRDYISNERTKHIERRHLKVRELVEDAVINVKYIATHLNVADIFTKPLERKQFQSLRDKLFNI